MPRRLVLLANPAAGGGRGREALAQACAVLERAGVEHRAVATRSLEDATTLATEAVAADETVVAVGGDGLVGRLAGVVKDTGGTLGVIPGGRGNDFARFLGLPLDPGEAAEALVSGRERLVDVGEVNGRPFVGIVSVGIDSLVNEKANQAKLVRGNLVYVITAIRQIVAWKPATFSLEVDGKPHQLRGYAVGVGNSGAYGGGMIVIPHATLDDGELDVFLSGDDSKLRFLRELRKRFDGSHVDNPAVAFLRGRTVTVDADRRLPVYADGEPIAELPITVTVRPGCLRVLAPT